MRSSANISPLYRCSACLAHACGICQPMTSPAEMHDLNAARAGFRNFTAGQQIYTQGECCDDAFTVLSGWVFLYRILEDGRRQILRFLVRGDTFGATVASKFATSHGAEVMTDVSICVIPQARLANLRQRHSTFDRSVAGLVEQEMDAAMELLTSLGRRNATERVAYLLMDCYLRIRKTMGSDSVNEVPLPLTQVAIADMLGLTAVHVNRVIRSLREERLLMLHRGRLTIFDIVRLKKLIGATEADNSKMSDAAGRIRRGPSPTLLRLERTAASTRRDRAASPASLPSAFPPVKLPYFPR